MPLWPDTHVTLISRLQHADDQRDWDEFVTLYRPAIYRFARRHGLQDADAHDATQRVLLSVSQAVQKWEPDAKRGKFRAWLAQITRNAVINIATRDTHRRGSGSTSIAELLESIPELSNADNDWLREQQIQRYRGAAEIVRPACSQTNWDAFWLTTVQGVSINDTARQLGVSTGVVYAARSRVLKRLRTVIEQIEERENGAS